MKLLVNGNAVYIPLKDKSVNLVVTSPPYFGLRSYSTSRWVGGDETCDHVANPNATKVFGNPEFNENRPSREKTKMKGYYYKDVCLKCGAIRIDEQIGLEETIDEYVEKMVMVGREIWRVLRDDGIFFLNLGDSYNGTGNVSGEKQFENNKQGTNVGSRGFKGKSIDTLKPKDKMFIPERTAMALQADGWWVRRDIIWAKGCSFNYKGGSTMPESCKDRPTTSHEYVYMLTKSKQYYYDYYGVLEDSVDLEGSMKRYKTEFLAGDKHESGGYSAEGARHTKGMKEFNGKRNLRSVWAINTASYPGSHYATFPPDLIEPMILAGCPEKVCAECGAPYERVVESVAGTSTKCPKTDLAFQARGGTGEKKTGTVGMSGGGRTDGHSKLLGWQPTCDCNAETKPGVVFDPFVGSGTTVMVANKHGRKGIGMDLSYEYLNVNARERLLYGQYVFDEEGNKQFTLGV